MIWILAVIVKKLNLGKGFEKSVDDIVLEIKKSDEAKEKAIELKDEAQRILDDLPQDIETIEKSSAEKTKAFKDSIEEKKISNLITEKTSKASIELARQHIQDLLNKNPELHNKYILESLDELEKVKL